MKFKIQAGAEIDVPSRKEIQDIVDRSNQSTWEQYTTGLVYRQYVQAGFTLQNASPQLIGGPEPGLTWSVKRVSLPIPNGTTFELHFNDGNPSTYIGDVVRGPNVFSSDSLIVKPGNQLVLYIPTGGPVAVPAVMVAFAEIPMDQEWKL